MQNPLRALGSHLLDVTSEADSAVNRFSTLSRRGFILGISSLSSCAAMGAGKRQSQAAVKAAAAPAKTQANTGYRTPPVKGPVPRNPDQRFGSDTSHVSGLTFTRVHVAGKYIAMTYDDGPHPKNTPRLLDMLRERNIKATFYVIGQSVGLHPEVVRRTVAEGHEIGNHSNTHRQLSKLSDAEVIADLSRCRDAVASAAGVMPRTLRPPYGSLLQRQRELVHDKFGYTTILWSVDPLDWKRPGAGVIASRILKGASPGGIVLSHDLHSQTVDSMPATLDGLLRQGYRFVTVSQLLAMQLPAESATVAAAPSQS